MGSGINVILGEEQPMKEKSRQNCSGVVIPKIKLYLPNSDIEVVVVVNRSVVTFSTNNKKIQKLIDVCSELITYLV